MVTVPPSPASALPPQAGRGSRSRAADMAMTVRFMGVRDLSPEQVGHVDRHGSGGTAGRARAAVPALVDVHIGLAGAVVDGEGVQRAHVHAERAAVDALRLV